MLSSASTLRLPRRYLTTLLVRGVALWFLARIMAAVTIAWAELDTAGMDALLPAWTLSAIVALVFVDLWRRKELLLLHNLGVTTASAVAVASIPAVLIEATILLVRA